MSEILAGLCLIDPHVHLHPGMDAGEVLTAAVGHMDRAARALGLAARPPGLLVLTEVAGLDRFAELDGTMGSSTGGWQIAPPGEEISRLARPADGGAPIAITSGRQIITAEGLEVHALGTRSLFPDGLPMAEVLQAVRADGALAVLPWGVGKWSGRRGRIIADLIAGAADPRAFCLADSGVRPSFMGRPALLAEAERRGIRVLAGSDPLPLAGGARNAGRFGIVAHHPFDADRPFAAFRGWLEGLEASPGTYGRLETPLAFLRAQIAMQIRKRFG